MLRKLLVNLKQFDEGKEDEEDFSQYIGENGELDIDSLVDDFQSESSNDDEDHQEYESSEEEEPETSEESESEEESEQTDEPESEEGEESEPESSDKQTSDQAFAAMRRKNEENEPLAEWVKNLAQEQGYSDPNQLIKDVQDRKMEQEAKQKGVPPDVYKRLNELEKENKEKDENMYRERFNNEVAQTKDKYGLSNEDVTEVFQFMGQQGYTDENGRASIPFEDAYVLANKDRMIEKAKEEAKQEYLNEKEKKQKQAAPNAGTNKEDKTNNTEEFDYSAEGIFKTLEKMGIDYD